MSNKIEFEDRTKPQEKTITEIEHLASSFSSGALRVGALGKFSVKEIILAFIIGAKDLCNYSLETEVITQEDLEKIKDVADEISNYRAKTFKESGLIDGIKRTIRESERNAILNPNRKEDGKE